MSVEVSKLFSLTGHKDSIYTIIQGLNPWEVYSAGGDGWLVSWDLRQADKGELLARVPNSVYSLETNTEKGLLLAGQNQQGIHFIDIHQKQEIRSIQFTDGSIFEIKKWNSMLFAGCENGEIVVIDEKNLVILKRLKLGTDRVRSMVIDENNHVLIAGYSDRHIRIIDLHTMTLKKEWQAHDNSVFTVVLSPNGTLLSAGRDAHLKEWTIEGQAIHDVVGHMYTINHITFHPDGNFFVTCSMDKTIKLWRLHDFKLLKVIDKGRHAGHGTSVNKLVWSPFNNYLLSASDDRTISGWQLQISE